MGKHAVIVGAGQAAASFAAKLRELDPAWRIAMVGEEPVAPYQRPPLSKKYMTGEVSAGRLALHAPEWYRGNGVECLFSKRAAAIDRHSKTILLDDGTALKFDRLLIAAGAAPRRLASEAGGDLPGVYTLRSLADADALGAEMRPGRRLLVVGGGYIGLEAAAVAAKLGLAVTVVEMAPRILQRVASQATSDYFRAAHRAHGVAIMESVALTRLTGTDGRVTGAEFSGGKTLEADFVLVGIGVAPNDGLAKAAGLSVENGIAVDLACRTSDPDILAAGDCASFEFRGRRIRLESVQNAIDQGEAAAATVAGNPATYRPVPWFWSDQYDIKLQIAGLNLGHDNTVLRPGSRPGAQSVWYFAGREFLAVDAMNEPRAYMSGKRLLESGRKISPDQAADPAFDLKSLM